MRSETDVPSTRAICPSAASTSAGMRAETVDERLAWSMGLGGSAVASLGRAENVWPKVVDGNGALRKLGHCPATCSRNAAFAPLGDGHGFKAEGGSQLFLGADDLDCGVESVHAPSINKACSLSTTEATPCSLRPEKLSLNYLYMDLMLIVEREIRAQGGTLAEFARQIGVSAQNITNWKKRGVPGSKYRVIAHGLGWSVDDLLAGGPDRNRQPSPSVCPPAPASVATDQPDMPAYLPPVADGYPDECALASEADALFRAMTPRQQRIFLATLRATIAENREILAYATGSQVTEKQHEIGGGARLLRQEMSAEPEMMEGQTAPATAVTDRRITTSGRPPGGRERRH